MVNKPLIRPYLLGGVALGGAARIPLIYRDSLLQNCNNPGGDWASLMGGDLSKV